MIHLALLTSLPSLHHNSSFLVTPPFAMARKTAGYQTIPDTADTADVANTTSTDSTDPHSPTITKSSSQNSLNNSSAHGGGSAGVPPKIINPTKQAFAPLSPTHAPGGANVAAKSNIAAGNSNNPGSGKPNAAAATHNLPTIGVSSSTVGGVNSAAANVRGKVKQPMRTTKTSQKLALFPEEKDVPVPEDDYVFDDTTYNQIGQLSSGT